MNGLQDPSGQVLKIFPPPGLNSRNVQPITSRYTDHAIRPTPFLVENPKLNNILLAIFSLR